jgi:hypothetical protein
MAAMEQHQKFLSYCLILLFKFLTKGIIQGTLTEFNIVKRRKLIYRLIAIAGLFCLVDISWATVSLHAWIFICSSVAAFHIISYLTKHNQLPKQ